MRHNEGINLTKKWFQFLCLSTDCRELPKPGDIVIGFDGDAWDHPHVVLFRRFVEEFWEPRRRYVLLLPCSPRKPYYTSNFRKILYYHMTRLNLWEHVELVTVSDLLGLVPKEFEGVYPAANYEYPPSLMKKYGHEEELIELLGRQMKKLRKTINYAWMPKTYIPIIKKASQIASIDIKIRTYSTLPFKTAATIPKTLYNIIHNPNSK